MNLEDAVNQLCKARDRTVIIDGEDLARQAALVIKARGLAGDPVVVDMGSPTWGPISHRVVVPGSKSSAARPAPQYLLTNYTGMGQKEAAQIERSWEIDRHAGISGGIEWMYFVARNQDEMEFFLSPENFSPRDTYILDKKGFRRLMEGHDLQKGYISSLQRICARESLEFYPPSWKYKLQKQEGIPLEAALDFFLSTKRTGTVSQKLEDTFFAKLEGGLSHFRTGRYKLHDTLQDFNEETHNAWKEAEREKRCLGYGENFYGSRNLSRMVNILSELKSVLATRHRKDRLLPDIEAEIPAMIKESIDRYGVFLGPSTFGMKLPYAEEEYKVYCKAAGLDPKADPEQQKIKQE